MTKYVAYYRVSTKNQGESGLGLESQRTIIDYFANEGEIIAEFTDIASGKTAERVELKKAIAYCKEHGCTLIVAKADRLSRNVVDALNIYDELNEKLLCCDVPATDRFTLTIIFAVAERERLLISLRTSGALKEVKKRTDEENERLGKKRIGREKGTDTSVATARSIEVRKENRDNRMSDAIILAKNEREHGTTLQGIADLLNSTSHRTSRGKLFTPKSVQLLLLCSTVGTK